MLNLKDITAMTFHLNENNNPEEKKTSLKVEINESFWLGNYDSKSRLLLYVTLDFLDRIFQFRLQSISSRAKDVMNVP